MQSRVWYYKKEHLLVLYKQQWLYSGLETRTSVHDILTFNINNKLPVKLSSIKH